MVLVVAFPLHGQTEPMSVCELQAKLRTLGGTEVVVQGILGGGRHGTYLNHGDGVESCPGIDRSGLTWPAAIAAERPRDWAKLPDAEKLDRIWIHIVGDGPWTPVVVKGKVRTKRDLEIHKLDFDGGPVYVGNGYGSTGGTPALIVVSDIDIVKRRE